MSLHEKTRVNSELGRAGMRALLRKPNISTFRAINKFVILPLAK